MPFITNADEMNHSVVYGRTSEATLTPVVKANTHERNEPRSRYYLVDASVPYKGDNLVLSNRKFETTRKNINYSGFYFLFGNLLILWDREKPHYQFISIEAIENGVWKSCWSNTATSANTCDSNSDLVHIFADENAAIAFNNDSEQSDEQALLLDGEEQ
ncbi:MAG: hypothetical protein AB8B79_11695, partial [Granulosicoccus sp.]